MKQPQKFTTQRRGAVVVEAALVLPILLMLLFGTVEYSRYLSTMSALRNAARRGAEYAAIHTSTIILDGSSYGNLDSDVKSVVNAYIGSGQVLAGQQINLYQSDSQGHPVINPVTGLPGAWTGASTGNYICLQIQGTYNFLAAGLLKLPATMTMTVQTVRRSEGN